MPELPEVETVRLGLIPAVEGHVFARVEARRADLRVAFPPQAGYLTWLDCRYAELGDDPAAAFLEHGRVALYPGLKFGAPGAGHARLNVGTMPELVDEMLTRMASALAR